MLVSWHHFLATHTHRTALCPGLPGWAGTRKVKPIWILLKQETVSGSGISWTVCKSAPRSRQITTPAPQQQLVDKESLCSGCFAWQYSLQVLAVSEFRKAFFGFFSAFLCTTICLYASVRVLLNSQTDVKPIWILLKQETVSGSGISWTICKSAPRSTQITMPVLHHSKFFTGRMPFLPPNQQRQSTEGNSERQMK